MACCRMAGEEKFGYFRLSEGTEGEDGSWSGGSSWLEVVCGGVKTVCGGGGGEN